jgi:hypothetical protein
VLEELPNDGENMVDARRTRRPALACAGTDGQCGAQEQHEPAQMAGAILQAAPAAPTPIQEPCQFAGVHPGGGLRPVTAEAEVKEKLVGDRHLEVIVVNHRPIRPSVG